MEMVCIVVFVPGYEMKHKLKTATFLLRAFNSKSTGLVLITNQNVQSLALFSIS